MDGVQIPVVAAETEGRASRVGGQRARTRECKLGSVFTQTTVDEEGWPIRDPDSTIYVAAIETAEEFGFRIDTPTPGFSRLAGTCTNPSRPRRAPTLAEPQHTPHRAKWYSNI